MSTHPRPLYDPNSAEAAYHLRYAWTCWPSDRTFAARPTRVLDDVIPLWETDGLRLLESTWTAEKLQIVFSTKPHVSPVILANRAKGRLAYAIRMGGHAVSLSKKTAVRSLGENTSADVARYIAEQVTRERFIESRFEEQMRAFTVCDSSVDLSAPAESTRGRYWYNLHLVLVTAERYRIPDTTLFASLRDACFRIAAKKDYRIARVAVMPDHVHMAIRGDYRQSPEEIVYAFQNNLAYVVGQQRIWQDSYYVGTFGEYNMNAVRKRIAEQRVTRDETPRDRENS